MSEPGDTRRDLRFIRWLYKTANKPIPSITGWAKKRNRIHRFSSAQKWARQMQEAAQGAKSRAKWKALRYRYAEKVKWLESHKDSAPLGDNLLPTVDGRQVPAWIASILLEARASGAWSGYVISGYRSPSYSISLCYAMCGASSCPGKCAGAASNHACPPSGTGVPYEGAVDVTDPYSLERFCRNHAKPLYGGGYALPYDHPHFSRTGR